jgi:hypothetical protein
MRKSPLRWTLETAAWSVAYLAGLGVVAWVALLTTT